MKQFIKKLNIIIGHFELVSKRFRRRIRNSFRLKEMFLWGYESCKRCGNCIRVVWSVKDQMWRKVVGVDDDGGGSLCIECFLKIAEDKNIMIPKDVIEKLEILDLNTN